MLECEVPLILGMTFLSKVAPKIDFGRRVVSVVHKGVSYDLPACSIHKNSSSSNCGSSDNNNCSSISGSNKNTGCDKNGDNVSFEDHNSFRGLPVNLDC